MWYDWIFSICPIVIAIRPLPSGLFYTCTLNKNTEVIHVGPLQEEGVIGMPELSVLVRETALSAYKGLKRSLSDFSHPYISCFCLEPAYAHCRLCLQIHRASWNDQ